MRTISKLRKGYTFRSLGSMLVILGIVEMVRGALLITLFPAYAPSHLGVGLRVVGLAISAHYLMDTFFKSPFGWMVDRFGSKKMLIFGLSLSLVSLLLLQHMKSPYVLIGLTALYGVGTSPTWPSVVTGATGLVPDEKRATTMGFVFISWLIGAGIGPVGINFILSKSDHLAFAVLIVFLAVAWVLSFTLRGRELQHGKITRDHHVATHLKEVAASLKGVWILFPGMFVQTMALGLLLPVMAVYATHQLHLSHMQYAFFLITGGAVTVVLLVPVGKIVNRVGSRILLIVGFGVSAFSLYNFTIRHSIPALYMFVALVGAAYALILPAWNSLLDRVMPEDKRGVMWGVFMSIEGLGLAIGPAIGGVVWEWFGPTYPFRISATVLFVMCLFYIVYPVEKMAKKSINGGK